MKKTGYMDDGNITLLAKGVELKGEIKVDGTVRIDGRLEGEVHTKGEVIVGEDGVVKGTITAGSLISSGRIKAAVSATERVQLLKTAILIGEVHSPIMVMEEGAKFQGVSDMGATAWPEEVRFAKVYRRRHRLVAVETEVAISGTGPSIDWWARFWTKSF